MIRGCLVGLLYNKSLTMNLDDLDCGRAVTLMSTDVDGVSNSGEIFHEIWAQAIEVLVGMTLLAQQVSWFWPVPLIIIFCKTPATAKTIRAILTID